MDLILLTDLEKVGQKHEVITVKPGFGRNYLIPKGLAIIANETNRAKLEKIKAREEAARAERLAEFQAVADKLEGKILKIGAKSGTSGKIFGSVTNIQVASALKEQFDIEVDRKDVVLPDEIKTLGTYQAKLDLHKDLDINVDFEVVSE